MIWPDGLLHAHKHPLDPVVVMEDAPFDFGGSKLRGKLMMTFNPSDRIVVVATADLDPNQPSWSIGIGKAPCTLIKEGVSFPAITSSFPEDLTTWKLRSIERDFAARPDRQIEALAFHLVNFRGVSDAVSMDDGHWELVIGEHPNTKTLVEALGKETGYGLTHWGMLRRLDGKPFLKTEADDVFASLHYFLSFARGRWVSTAMIYGLTNGQWEWDVIGVNQISSDWTEFFQPSWLPGLPSTHDSLRALFPLFRKAWLASERELRRGVFWYVSANMQEGRTGGSIVFAHSALELLSWNHVVDTASKTQAKKQSDNDRFRKFFGALGIDNTVPAALACLVNAAAANNDDLAAVLNRLRNNLVHPEDKAAGALDSGDIQYEGWKAMLWLTELGLLYRLGYCGYYVDRLASEVDQSVAVGLVPWA